MAQFGARPMGDFQTGQVFPINRPAFQQRSPGPLPSFMRTRARGEFQTGQNLLERSRASSAAVRRGMTRQQRLGGGFRARGDYAAAGWYTPDWQNHFPATPYEYDFYGPMQWWWTT